MKRAFTMIELVFVIVILGIISAIAVPKLAATRQDARMTQLIANTNIFIKDLKTYYAQNGEFAPDIRAMSNIVGGNYNDKRYGKIFSMGEFCLMVAAKDDYIEIGSGFRPNSCSLKDDLLNNKRFNELVKTNYVCGSSESLDIEKFYGCDASNKGALKTSDFPNKKWVVILMQ